MQREGAGKRLKGQTHCFPFRKHYFDIEQPASHKGRACAHTLLLEDFFVSLEETSLLTAIVCQKDAVFVSMLKMDKALHVGGAWCSSCLRRHIIAEQKPERCRTPLQVKGGKRANPGIGVVGWSSLGHCPDEDKATGEQNCWPQWHCIRPVTHPR